MLFLCRKQNEFVVYHRCNRLLCICTRCKEDQKDKEKTTSRTTKTSYNWQLAPIRIQTSSYHAQVIFKIWISNVPQVLRRVYLRCVKSVDSEIFLKDVLRRLLFATLFYLSFKSFIQFK